jgi:hypothetical protein
MVVTDPTGNPSRNFKEALIRVVDILAYLNVLTGGVGAVFATPQTVLAALHDWEFLIIVWQVFLIAGGALGFIGRLTRIWVIEIPGAGLGVFGAAIYFVILASAAVDGFTALVAAPLVLCLGWLMLRRYIELQIFTSEPGEKSWTQRIREILRRRTTNTVGQHR